MAFPGWSTGPLLAAFIILPRGQRSVAFFSLVALRGIIVLSRVSAWYQRAPFANWHSDKCERRPTNALPEEDRFLYLHSRGARFLEIFYLASLVSYYTCYLIRRFRLTVGTRRLTFSAFSARSPSVS